MNIDFSNIFPNVSQKKHNEYINDILYIALVEWGWSYDDFLNTPMWVINRLIIKHNEKIKKQKNAK